MIGAISASVVLQKIRLKESAAHISELLLDSSLSFTSIELWSCPVFDQIEVGNSNCQRIKGIHTSSSWPG